MSSNRRRFGFTLIELLVVIAIAGGAVRDFVSGVGEDKSEGAERNLHEQCAAGGVELSRRGGE